MPYKILVADDESIIVEALRKRLLQEGYNVSIAFDGDEAILRVEQDSPDVILLDLKMPKKNGFEVLTEIRSKYLNKWIPVIIVSAVADFESLKKSYSLEADHYLTKPCPIEAVLQGIETMISLIPLRQKK